MKLMAKTEQYIERTDGQLILFVPVEGAPDPRNPLDERLMKGFFERKTSLNRVAGAAEFLEQGLAFGTDMREF